MEAIISKYSIPLLALSILIATGSIARGEDGPDLTKAQTIIIDQTNALRQQNGLAPVKINEKLTKTVRDFATFMASTGKYGHQADGHEPSQRATKHGYQYALIDENIAWDMNSEGFTTQQLADGFEKGWEHSPEHRKNMLDPDVTDIGVGIAKASDGKYYAVQMFGRPKSAATTFTIQNRSRETIRYSVDDQSFELRPGFTREHTVGRPPEVKITLPDETKAAVVRPRDNAEYVIRPARGGKLEISGPKDRPTTQPSTTQASKTSSE